MFIWEYISYTKSVLQTVENLDFFFLFYQNCFSMKCFLDLKLSEFVIDETRSESHDSTINKDRTACSNSSQSLDEFCIHRDLTGTHMVVWVQESYLKGRSAAPGKR